MDIRKAISKKVSFQSNAWSSIEREISIEQVMGDIKIGRYAKEIQKLRCYLNNDEKDKYDMQKKRLPGVTFCGNFNGNRKKELIKTYHKLVVLDIDKLDNEELKRVKNILEYDEYVFTCWVSPSEHGIKGLIYLEYKFEIDKYGIDLAHRHAFKQITEYFKNSYSIELDTSGSDTTRLCFLSYDPNLLFKSAIVPFPIDDTYIDNSFSHKQPSKPQKGAVIKQYIRSKDVLNNPKGKNNQGDRKTLHNIIKFLKKKNISITSTYENWYRVAYAIANSFTHGIGERYFLSLCELDGANHDETQSKNMLLYCYQNSRGKIKFNTITFLARKKGFQIRGNST